MTSTQSRVSGWEEVVATAREVFESAPGAMPEAVGVVGADVPVELLEAMGFEPFALNGVPGSEPVAAHGWLEPAVDGASRSILHEILAGRYEGLERVLFGHDCEGTARGFMTMRELTRIGAVPNLPDTHLVDMQRISRKSSTDYTVGQIALLMEKLASWGGSASADLSGTIGRSNRLRLRLRSLAETRRARSIPGTDALTLIGACRKLPAGEATLLLDRALAAVATRADLCGVFVTGMDHHSPGLYRLLESCGSVVVGEDHAWGGGWGTGLIDEGRDPLEAIAAYYQSASAGSSGRGIRHRGEETLRRAVEANADAVICFVRPGDSAPHWDIPMQRACLSASSIPLLVIGLAAFDDRLPEATLDQMSGFLEAVDRGLVPDTARVEVTS